MNMGSAEPRSREQIEHQGPDLSLLLEYAKYQEEDARRGLKSAPEHSKGRFQREIDSASGIIQTLSMYTKSTLGEALKSVKDTQDLFTSAGMEKGNEVAVTGMKDTVSFLERNHGLDILRPEMAGFKNWLEKRVKEQADAKERMAQLEYIDGKFVRKGIVPEKQTEQNHQLEKAMIEQELREERLLIEVLIDGGAGAVISWPAEYNPKKSGGGFYPMTDDRLIPRGTEDSIGYNPSDSTAEFFIMKDWKKDRELKQQYAQANCREFVTFLPVTTDVYEDKDVPVQEKIMGGLFGSKTVIQKQSQRVGERQVMHNEVVADGKKEQLVKLIYIAQSKDSLDQFEDDINLRYRDYSGRDGNMLSIEVLLPQSTATKVEQEVRSNPAFIRKIADEMMTKKFKVPENAWFSGDKYTTARSAGSAVTETESLPLRPPYEKWDAVGESLYFKEQNGNPKEIGAVFNPESVIPIKPGTK